MEMETMFTEQKWNILKCLAENKYSPLQLAEKLDTTMANISQQLRLLEASKIVKKEKIRNREKGKPRTLFSLNNDYAYLISASDRFADKRLIKVDEHHKSTLRIWFLEDTELQYNLERLYWQVEQNIEDIEAIAVDIMQKRAIIISDKEKKIHKSLSNATMDYKIINEKEAEKQIKQQKGVFSFIDNISIIYDPNNLLKKTKTLNAQ